MNQAIRKLSGLLVLPVLLAALLLLPVSAKAEGYECFAELPVHVDLNGENDEQFHVTIQCAPDADPSQPMPDEAETVWIAGDGDDAFHNFHFTEPGDYKYIVTQECGDTAYMTYDDVVYTVIIQVTNWRRRAALRCNTRCTPTPMTTRTPRCRSFVPEHLRPAGPGYAEAG